MTSKRKLGRNGPELTALGLGCMGMSGLYNQADDTRSAEVLNKALDLGIELLDTADIYGHGHNEELIGKAIGTRYAEAFIASKFGILVSDAGGMAGASGKPDYVRDCCDASLRRLQTDCIDLFFIHRTDPDTPIEDTMGALADLVQAGKIRYIGLSEASVGTIRRAAAVHPIAAVESEYSIFTRDVEAQILPACREIGAAFIAYSPLGRGMLTGTLGKMGEHDIRAHISDRFSGDNLKKNLTLVRHIKAIGDRHGATPAQVALAWVLAQGDDMFAIFGTTQPANLQANLKAMQVQLNAAELAELSALSTQVQGTRYTEAVASHCMLETPKP